MNRIETLNIGWKEGLRKPTIVCYCGEYPELIDFSESRMLYYCKVCKEYFSVERHLKLESIDEEKSILNACINCGNTSPILSRTFTRRGHMDYYEVGCEPCGDRIMAEMDKASEFIIPLWNALNPIKDKQEEE